MIRKAEEKDIPEIAGLLMQVLQVHHTGRPDIFKATGQKYTDQELKDIINDAKTPVFVYEDEEGRVLGHIFCQMIDRVERPSCYAYKTLYIDDLCVEEKARGKHVGSELYEYVKKYAQENDVYNITLHAWACNEEAMEFYGHLGMEVQQYTFEEVVRQDGSD